MIEYLNDIRWDVRPSPALGTVEVRICDGVSNLRELAALTALTHCLVVDLTDRLSAGETLPTMPPWHVQENKWRAARYGLDAEIILDAAAQRTAGHRRPRRPAHPARAVAARLGCADELRSVDEITRARGVVPAAAAGGGRDRRRPGRGGRLGGARARPGVSAPPRGCRLARPGKPGA